MASSKVMPTSSTSTSTISDHSLLPSSNSIDFFHLNHSFNPTNNRFHGNNLGNRDRAMPELGNSDAGDVAVSPMNVDGMFSGGGEGNDAMLDAEITLIDAAGAISAVDYGGGNGEEMRRRTAEEVWREIVEGGERRECKVEASEEMMTLEDFLARATAGEEDDAVVSAVEEGVKMEGSVSGAGMYGFDHQLMVQGVFPMAGVVPPPGFGNGRGAAEVAVTVAHGGGGGGGRGKRSRGSGAMMETLDKAAQQRQRRMIKNRESAARSRERKQAYQIELEALAAKLEEENEQLLREKAQRTKERYMQLMEKIVPVVESRCPPPRPLRRVRSMQW